MELAFTFLMCNCICFESPFFFSSLF